MHNNDSATDPGRQSRLAFAALLLGAVFIGLSPILVRLSEVEPVATAFHRVFLGLPLMLGWLVITGNGVTRVKAGPVRAVDLAWLLLPGVFFAGDLGFWHWSIHLTTVANATLFANFAPVYVTIASIVLFRERFSRRFILALTMSIAGAVVLMGTSTGLSRDHVTGDALGMVAAMFYAAYLLVVGRLRLRYSTILIMFWSCLSASLILLPAAWMSEDMLLPSTWAGWGVLATLAWVSHLCGQGLIAYALAHLSTALSSVSLLLQPVCSAVLAWILFSEALGPMQITGGLIVLTGIYLVRRASLVPA
jgi:drug/metabolite transporter (DMT)-like permease